MVRQCHAVIAVRGNRLALTRLEVGTADVSPGAPQDEMLRLIGLDEEGRIALLLWFDVEDIDAATAELDAAHARLEQEHQRVRGPENAASQAYERIYACYAARDWDAVTETVAEDFSIDDRRRVVNAGFRPGRDAGIEDLRASADVGFKFTMLGVMATRGGCLALMRVRASGPDPGAIQNDAANLVEIDADGRIAAVVVFDLDDFDAAIAKLDARYLAGEAAAHAHTWSAITDGYAALNRRELPPTMPDWVNIDHRRGTSIAPGEMPALLSAVWNLTTDLSNFIETVHRLNNLGAVVTHVAHETSQDGFHAEWRVINLLTLDGDIFNRCEVFDETDLDAALAKFDQLSRRTPRLENAAAQVCERALAHFAARDSDALAEVMADNYSSDDRRRVVGAGVRHGRDAQIADMQAIADLFITNVTTVIATRGERLVLVRHRLSDRDFLTEVLAVFEINADERIVASVAFDLDDIDFAIAELDARYLAGEAAAHAHIWSVVREAYAALNRHELPPTVSDWVTIDHRVRATFEGGDLTAYIRAAWDLTPDLNIYIEAVHRLSNLGVVVTHTAYGTSREGLDAEWKMIELLTVGGDQINRCELFDEADLDAALARFEEMQPHARRLENVASQVAQRFSTRFAARDWDAIAEILADNFSSDDRRRVVGAGVQHGRDAQVVDMRVVADLWITNLTLTVMATRGERLVLMRLRFSDRDRGPEAFFTEVLAIVESNADERIVALVLFDLDDTDSAFEELDARYLAGEAAAHAHMWSVITEAHAAINRHEIPPTTPDWVTIDHRVRETFRAGDLTAYIRSMWDVAPDAKTCIESVQRLTDHGAVVTRVTSGTSPDGFEAEWRMIELLAVGRDLVNRCELYDEADLDAALARFDELQSQTPRLENAASQVSERYLAHFAAGDWDAMAEVLADNFSTDDRRRVVGAGVRDGREAEIVNMRAIADLWITNVTSTVMATRGERLCLVRVRFSDRDQGPEAFLTEWLGVGEINADEQIVAIVGFDLDDIDAAFHELDARYLAGEAAAHSRTWSVIAQAHAGINRREFPSTTPNPAYIDHRLLVTIEGVDLAASLRALWDLTPDISICIEAVHRLSELGAVVTQALKGTSPEGFDAEWRMVDIFTVDGDLISRAEVFEETDLDTALTRFEELHPQARQLENAATQVTERFLAHFAARNWAAIAEILAEDSCIDDRRRVVNAGFWDGRDVVIANMRALDEGGANITWTVIATRGDRLALTHICSSNRNPRHGEFGVEMLGIAEINSDERFAAHVLFDLDNIDAAFAELDARYLAGEAAAHSRTWFVVAQACAALNRREISSATPDFENIDHRRGAKFAPGNLAEYLRAGWDLDQDIKISIEAVHRLSDLGAIVTHAACGQSRDGFDAEWRVVSMLTVDGDTINRAEIFDEADLDAAFARFEELHPQARRLENAASQVGERFFAHFAARDWDAMAEMVVENFFEDDRRRVVGSGVRHGRDAQIVDMRAIADLGTTFLTSTVATRGEHLALTHQRLSFRDQGPEGFLTDVLVIVEINADERLVAGVSFDPDDIDAAFEELDARYLAGEAAAHAHTWSVNSGFYAAFNRHELPATTPDWIYIDHRPLVTIEATDLPQSIRAVWDLTPDMSVYMEAVHRLSDLGAVVTAAVYGTSQEGFDAEWRMIDLFTVDGNLINRCEIFDETDLDAALARFEELHAHAPRPENAASQVEQRFTTYFATRNWDAIAELIADDFSMDDRRRTVNAGVRHGLDAEIASLRAIADVGVTSMTLSTVIAIRGGRLALGRYCVSDSWGETKVLSVLEINAENQIVARVGFDSDDLDAAFEELDARYLAGEAAAHAQIWSVIAGLYAGFNRHQRPATTPDWIYIDHRPLIKIEASDLSASIDAIWEQTPDISIYIEAVHRLSDLGAVVTHTARGISREDFDAEWRLIAIFTVEGDLISRCEMFDEADIEAALARFDELDRPAPTA